MDNIQNIPQTLFMSWDLLGPQISGFWGSGVRNDGTRQNTLEKNKSTKHLEQGRKGGITISMSTSNWERQNWPGAAPKRILQHFCAFPWAFGRALAKQTPWIRGAFSLTQDKVIPIECKNQDSFWYKTKQTLLYHIQLILSLLEKSRLNFKECLFLCKWKTRCGARIYAAIYNYPQLLWQIHLNMLGIVQT